MATPGTDARSRNGAGTDPVIITRPCKSRDEVLSRVRAAVDLSLDVDVRKRPTPTGGWLVSVIIPDTAEAG